MSAGVLVGLGIALLASLALNTAFLLQHSGIATAPALSLRRPKEALRSFVGSRVWMFGLALGVAGWLLHIAALKLAPLSLVQAFVAGGLALAVPVAALGFHHSLERAERIGVVALALALALLPLGLGHVGRHDHFHHTTLAIYLGVVGAAALLLATRQGGPHGAQMLGLAAGAFYGVADTAIKALTSLSSSGVEKIASPWLVIGAVATFGGFACLQRGLQTGRPLPVIAFMTGVTNLASIPAGFIVFGDPIGLAPGWIALHVVAFIVVIVAAYALAPVQATISETLAEAREDGDDPSSATPARVSVPESFAR
jgi:hypothetical protein